MQFTKPLQISSRFRGVKVVLFLILSKFNPIFNEFLGF